MNDLYEQDLALWAEEQAKLLRAGKLSEADVENIAEEIESMGSSERRALASHMMRLLQHLLKWVYQPERRGSSWQDTISEQRSGIELVLDDSPSLRPTLPAVMAKAYERGRRLAELETKLKGLMPLESPWTFEQVMTLPIELD
jgi:hypothetical protein